MVLDYEKPQWTAFLQTRQITVISDNPRPQVIAYIKDYCRYFLKTFTQKNIPCIDISRDIFEAKNQIDNITVDTMTSVIVRDQTDNEEVRFLIDQDAGRQLNSTFVKNYLAWENHSKDVARWMIDVLFQNKKPLPITILRSLNAQEFQDRILSINSAGCYTLTYGKIFIESLNKGCSVQFSLQMLENVLEFGNPYVKTALDMKAPEAVIKAMLEKMEYTTHQKMSTSIFQRLIQYGYPETCVKFALSKIDTVSLACLVYALQQKYSQELCSLILKKTERVTIEQFKQAMYTGFSEEFLVEMIDRFEERESDPLGSLGLYSIMERYSRDLVEKMIAKGAAKSSRYAYKNLTTALSMKYPEAMVKDFLNEVKSVSEQQYATAQRSGYSPEILGMLKSKSKMIEGQVGFEHG